MLELGVAVGETGRWRVFVRDESVISCRVECFTGELNAANIVSERAMGKN